MPRPRRRLRLAEMHRVLARAATLAWAATGPEMAVAVGRFRESLRTKDQTAAGPAHQQGFARRDRHAGAADQWRWKPD